MKTYELDGSSWKEVTQRRNKKIMRMMTWKYKNIACTNFISFGGLAAGNKKPEDRPVLEIQGSELMQSSHFIKKIQLERKQYWNLGSELSGEKPLEYFVI